MSDPETGLPDEQELPTKDHICLLASVASGSKMYMVSAPDWHCTATRLHCKCTYTTFVETAKGFGTWQDHMPLAMALLLLLEVAYGCRQLLRATHKTSKCQAPEDAHEGAHDHCASHKACDQGRFRSARVALGTPSCRKPPEHRGCHSDALSPVEFVASKLQSC